MPVATGSPAMGRCSIDIPASGIFAQSSTGGPDARQAMARVLSQKDRVIGPEPQGPAPICPSESAQHSAWHCRKPPRTEPSALKNTSLASVSCPGRMTASWSKPTPAMAVGDGRDGGGIGQIAGLATVDHDEIVAKPVHLHEGQARFCWRSMTGTYPRRKDSARGGIFRLTRPRPQLVSRPVMWAHSSVGRATDF